MEFTVSPVNSKGTGLLSIKTLYKNPRDNPIRTPMNGFQKYHVEKNSFTLLGFGVTLHVLSIIYLIKNSAAKIKSNFINRNSIT